MTKLTDDELGELLRETFADKEPLVDNLPEATTPGRRRTMPILLAAASVLVVLGGILYAVRAEVGPEQVAAPGDATTMPRATNAPGSIATIAPPPGSTGTEAPAASENALVWAAVIAEVLKIERPAGGWPGIQIVDTPNAGAGGGSMTYELAKPFTIGKALPGVTVHWVRHRLPAGTKECEQPVAEQPYITVGPIVANQGHLEVGGNIWRGCLDGHWATYRLDRSKGSWKVTGTVGPVAVS
jgi:hypothetical protein